MEIAVPSSRYLSARSQAKRRNGTAVPIWSKGWRIAAPATRHAMCSGAERNSAQFAGGDVDNWQRLCAQRSVPRAGALGCRCLVRLFARRLAPRPRHGARDRWRRWSVICPSVSSSDVRAIAVYMAGVSERRRRIANVRARRRWSEAKSSSVKSSPVRFPSQRGRCVDLRCGLRVMPRERTAAALWRGQSGPQYRDRQPRSAQSRQYRAVRRPGRRR